MDIVKGQKIVIHHSRKGTFTAEAIRDFNLTEEFWPVKVAQDKVSGLSRDWYRGDEIACRGAKCAIKVDLT